MRPKPDSDDPDRAGVLRREDLITRLRREAAIRDSELADLRVRLDAAEHELEDLRAIRDALTPFDLPERPGLDLAAAFVAAAERVSGDFYLVAEGPQDSTVLVVGDVVGHGLDAARRAAFVRTAFASTAPYSDDPRKLLGWANVALVERAGPSSDFVTVACVTHLPGERLLRWAYAGHPPALWLRDGRELTAPRQGVPLGLFDEPRYGRDHFDPSTPPPAFCFIPTASPRQDETETSSVSNVSAPCSPSWRTPHQARPSPSYARASRSLPPAPSPTISACSRPGSTSRKRGARPSDGSCRHGPEAIRTRPHGARRGIAFPTGVGGPLGVRRHGPTHCCYRPGRDSPARSWAAVATRRQSSSRCRQHRYATPGVGPSRHEDQLK
jgi:hypothetical protein